MSPPRPAIVLLLLIAAPVLRCHDNATRDKRSPPKMPGGYHLAIGGLHVGGLGVAPPLGYVVPAQGQFLLGPPQPAGVLPDVWLLMVKLRTSIQLRDNIVTVFGYILYRPVPVVDVQLYVALYDLYNGARLRRIHTPKLLYRLQELSFATPHVQFTILMQELGKIVPRYLYGACTKWLEQLQTNTVNMDVILRPGGGPLVADFLANIDPSLLHLFLQPSHFKPSSKQFVSQIALDTMGVFFNNILGALLDGSLPLTQSLVAAIMLHMPLEMFMAEVDEAQRFIADVLYKENPIYNFALSAAGPPQRQNPYDLVRAVLSALASAPEVDPFIKDAAEIILLHLLPPSFLTYNPNYKKLWPIVSGPDIDYVTLLDVIRPGEFPRDIVESKNKIVHAIQRHEIQMQLVVVGFVRHDYTDPRDLLVALLERLRRRGFLPAHLADSVLAVIAYLKLKIAAVDMDPRPVTSLTQVVLLFNSFKSPAVSQEIRDQAQRLMDEIVKLNLNWGQLLDKLPVNGSSNPRLRLVEVLQLLVAEGHVNNMKVVVMINNLVKKLTDEGNPLSCPVMTCPALPGEDEQTITPIEITTKPTTTTQPPPVVREIITPIIFDVDISSLLTTLKVDQADLDKLKKLQEYLNTHEALSLLVNINLQAHKTQADLMKTILNELRRAEVVRARPEIFNIVQFSLKHIEFNGYGAQKWKRIVRTVDLNHLFLNLNLKKMLKDGHNASIVRITKLLVDNSVLNTNDIMMSDMVESSRGEFLKEFLTRMAQHDGVKEQEKQDLELAKKYINKDEKSARKVSYTEVAV